MVGITIQNCVNQNDKPIGMKLRRKDQVSGDVIWSVFERVSQSNSRFNALAMLIMTMYFVRMPVGFGKHAIASKVRPHGTPQETYRGGEGHRKLFGSSYNNSDRKSR